jgi:protein phosphatase inhibitor 2
MDDGEEGDVAPPIDPKRIDLDRVDGVPRAVHVDSHGSGHDADEEEYLVGLSAEEREKHARFEQLRKKHYEMKNVAALLGHPEEELAEEADEDEDDQEGGVPTVPALPGRVNGSS